MSLSKMKKGQGLKDESAVSHSDVRMVVVRIKVENSGAGSIE